MIKKKELEKQLENRIIVKNIQCTDETKVVSFLGSMEKRLYERVISNDKKKNKHGVILHFVSFLLISYTVI